MKKPDEFPNLAPTEIDFLKLIGEDLTYEDIANKLHRSKRTIEGIALELYFKLDVKTRGRLDPVFYSAWLFQI